MNVFPNCRCWMVGTRLGSAPQGLGSSSSSSSSLLLLLLLLSLLQRIVLNFSLFFCCSYFLKLFLDKKYALPYRVLDAVVSHFMRFLEDARIMPVIWHQSLLAFIQRLIFLGPCSFDTFYFVVISNYKAWLLSISDAN